MEPELISRTKGRLALLALLHHVMIEYPVSLQGGVTRYSNVTVRTLGYQRQTFFPPLLEHPPVVGHVVVKPLLVRKNLAAHLALQVLTSRADVLTEALPAGK